MGSRVYSVAVGRTTGVFTRWSDVLAATRGYSGAVFRKCTSEEDARGFLRLCVTACGTLHVNAQQLWHGSTLLACLDGPGQYAAERHALQLCERHLPRDAQVTLLVDTPWCLQLKHAHPGLCVKPSATAVRIMQARAAARNINGEAAGVVQERGTNSGPSGGTVQR